MPAKGLHATCRRPGQVSLGGKRAGGTSSSSAAPAIGPGAGLCLAAGSDEGPPSRAAIMTDDMYDSRARCALHLAGAWIGACDGARRLPADAASAARGTPRFETFGRAAYSVQPVRAFRATNE
jgi:hypothetical protein